MDWQPIETAPKDGTDILCWLPPLESDPQRRPEGEMVVAYWFKDGWSFAADKFGAAIMCKPSHWKPTPEPPSAG